MKSSPIDDVRPLRVTPASSADREEIIRLWASAGLTTSYNDPGEDFDFAAGKPSSEVLVGRVDGKIAASVMVGYDGHRGWLYYVAVGPDFQKRGFGAAIVAEGERWLADQKVRKVLLLVRETNTSVVRFYEGLQYEAIPRVVMQKWLLPPDAV